MFDKVLLGSCLIVLIKIAAHHLLINSLYNLNKANVEFST
jgi:hypothetical protein